VGNLFVRIKCAGAGCTREPVDIEPPALGAKLVCVVCGHKNVYHGGHVRIVIGSDRYAAKFANAAYKLDDPIADLWTGASHG